MAWTGVVTNAGRALLDSYAGGGHTLNLTGATVGSGTVDVANLRIQTALSSEKDNASIISAEEFDGGVKYKVQVGPASASVGAYTAHQIGIWAKLDNGTSTLLMLAQDADAGVSVPLASASPAFAFALFIALAVDNTDDLTVNIDETAYVTVGTMQEAIDELKVMPFVVDIPSGQWSGSGSDYYITVTADNVTEESILVPNYDNASAEYLKGPVWCVPGNGSFTIHTSAIPSGTVKVMVQLLGFMGEAQYQVLADVYSTSQTYSKEEADAAISQSTAAALDGLKFLRVYLEANTPKTITVSNTARCMLFFVSGYNTCCGDAALAHYGTGHSDGRIWFHEATGITIDTSTDGRIVFTATQNTFCFIMALSGTYTEA